MRTQSASQKNCILGLTPPIPLRMAWRVETVEALSGFRLRVRFVDGTAGTVDLFSFIHSSTAGVFAALVDPQQFAQVHVEYGAVTWPGEIDLAPDAMYREIREHGEWLIPPRID